MEEELFLVEPESGAAADVSDRVLARLETAPLDGGTVEPELHACQVELITEPCRTATEAVAGLAELRRAVLGTGIGLLGSGTHPQRAEGASAFTDKPRYRIIRERLGDAVGTPIGGLHIHVGMPDPDTAIRVFNGLRRHLPLLRALSANAPFHHGRDSGLASARELAMRAWPRSGVPRALRDLSDFEAMARQLAAAADVPDYTWFWWKLRPHPRLGTVEVRALDAQTSLLDTAALIALTHCLARHEAGAEAARDPSPELVEEGSFQAARYGIAAELPDVDGRRRGLDEVLAEALELARPHAAALGCEPELERVDELVAAGGGAGRQRALHARAGIAGLTRELAALTVPLS